MAAVLASENPGSSYLDLGVEAYLKPSELPMHEFVVKHMGLYGHFPKREAFADHGWDIPPFASGGPEYVRDRMRDRFIHEGLGKAVSKAGGMVSSAPMEALQLLQDAVHELGGAGLDDGAIDYAATAVDDVPKYMADKLSGALSALRFGWPTLDDLADGFQGGDVLSIIGRPGTGKTMMAIYIAMNMWRGGVSPLFVSMEMNKSVIQRRMASVDAKVPLNQITKAMMTTARRDALMAVLEANRDMHPFHILDGALSSRVSDIRRHCMRLKPGVLFVDGAYLVRASSWKPGSRWEAVTDNAEEFKRDIAEALGIPVVLSYQFNREAEKSKSPGLQHIAGSDAVGQLSSVVLSLEEGEAVVGNVATRRIRVMKGRNGEQGEFTINWDFETPHNCMNFSEVGAETFTEDLQDM